MPTLRPPKGLEDQDYEDIEAAVLETARGRWFLHEHARRTRASETDRMSLAIERLEADVRQQREALLQTSLLLQTKPKADEATAAEIEEYLLDFVWILRQRGIDAEVCDLIEDEIAFLKTGAYPERKRSHALHSVLSDPLPYAAQPTWPAKDDLAFFAPPPLRMQALKPLELMQPYEKLQFFS
ncbi:MAG: hypothetical protein EBY21_03905 [Alphaproteobacteria bacterium]|nr:hypothetical protein [Alphaproteobacteria bacterium]